MSLVSEFLQKVGLIRNETQYHGNTKERVADTFETLFNLDVWFKKLDPQDPNAKKIYQADGTLVDLPTPAPKQIQQVPTYNDLPVPGEEGIVYYIIDEDEDYAWSDDLNDYYDYVEAKGFLDERASNLVGDLSEEEKLIIKNKLGIADAEATPATPFIFTPTDDFTLSEIKTALEADGWKWNDSRILIDLGTNNFTCNIDVTTPTMITVERNGTGSISFIGTNVSYGSEGISILTNSQISMALIKIISGTGKMIRISNKT